MPIKPISEHYSFTDIHPSVHDEESMTALELAGRLNGKVNECVNAINETTVAVGQRLDGFELEMEDKFRAQNETLSEYDSKMTAHSEKMIEHEEQTIPDTVVNKILDFIRDGQFDAAIRTYLGYLEGRINTLESNYTPGSTTADAELIDIRLTVNNYKKLTAGEAVRSGINYISNLINDVRYGVKYKNQIISGVYGGRGYMTFDPSINNGDGLGTGAMPVDNDGENFRYIYTDKIPASLGDTFYYVGRSKGNAVGVMFYRDNIAVGGNVFNVDDNVITEVNINTDCNFIEFYSFAEAGKPLQLYAWKAGDVGYDFGNLTAIEMKSHINQFDIIESDGYITTALTAYPIYDATTEYHSKRTRKIPCKAGDKFAYRGVGKFNAASCIMFGNVSEIISTHQYDGYAVITIPAGVNFVMFASYAEKGKPVTLEVSKLTVTPGIVANPLYNKEIAINGDSIAAGDGFEGGFGKIIAERNHMQYSNIAKGGATVATGTTYADGTARHHISSTIENMSKTADYIIVNGGLNDAWNNVALGEFVEGYTDNGDTRTFYGAFNYMCKQLALGFLGKKVGYIFPHNCNSGLDTGKEYYTAAKRVLEKWGIPYLDLSTQLPPFGHTKNLPLFGNMQAIYIPDGVHPNEDGYNYYYCDKIESWLKTL